MQLSIAPGPHGISAARLVHRRSALERLDGWPWLILHAVAYAIAISPAVESVLESFALPIILSTSIVAHVLCFLGQTWSVTWYFLVRFQTAKSLDDADSVYVEPVPHAGNPEIVPLIRKAASTAQQLPQNSAKVGAQQPPLSGAWLSVANLGFNYQSCLYDITPEGASGALTVARLVLPDACALGSYQTWGGWNTDQVQTATAKWGPNAIIMPSPTFVELMAEAVIAPFFVFQVCFPARSMHA